MNIGIYSPYFDALGGGERYMLTLAMHLSKKHKVSIFWDDPTILVQASHRFDLDLTDIQVTPNIFVKGNLIRKLMASREYDCIIFLSDGSVQMSLAHINVLHFQVPFAHIPFPPWKRMLYKTFICNSLFTKNNIDPRVGGRAVVVYPPVDVRKGHSAKKEQIILSVGRFHPLKNQDILISAFKKGFAKGYFRGWRLVLAGGLLPNDNEYFTRLESLTGEAPIELHPNIEYGRLQALYAASRIYWHAAGYGQTKPENMEHFGITTVEAMSAGSIPVVVNAGGLTEIVTHGIDGYVWNTIDELTAYTRDLIGKPHGGMLRKAKQQAKKFGIRDFTNAMDNALPFL